MHVTTSKGMSASLGALSQHSGVSLSNVTMVSWKKKMDLTRKTDVPEMQQLKAFSTCESSDDFLSFMTDHLKTE